MVASRGMSVVVAVQPGPSTCGTKQQREEDGRMVLLLNVMSAAVAMQPDPSICKTKQQREEDGRVVSLLRSVSVVQLGARAPAGQSSSKQPVGGFGYHDHVHSMRRPERQGEKEKNPVGRENSSYINQRKGELCRQGKLSLHP
eukprot:scaffold188110_cov19-Tisochrysis_lutea.AAC.1